MSIGKGDATVAKGYMRDRKGIAIENALFMLVVVFALCSIILTVSFVIKTRDMRDNEKMREWTYEDNIGESFVRAVREGRGSGYIYEDERYEGRGEESAGVYEFILKYKESKEERMRIKVKRTGEGVKIAEWIKK